VAGEDIDMSGVAPLLESDDITRLREALASAKYTSAGIAERIGPTAVEGVRRGDLRGLLRATSEGVTSEGATSGPDRLATLIRLFIAGRPCSRAAVQAALAPLGLEAAYEAGLVEPDADAIRAAVDLDLYGEGDWWVLSDVDVQTRPDVPVRPDHVLGIGNAATTLASATIRRPVETALDLGTGCGIQALALRTHASSVTATDILPRALRFAATTAALNGQEWELLEGDFGAPVRGRRFDLVVSNPPFIAGPGQARFTYRDSGRAGDGVCAELAAAAPDLLADGGTMQYLANWLYVAGEDWRERVAGWVAGTGCDAWIVQREVSDPVDYVTLWLRDASEQATEETRTEWLDWFDAHRVEAVGYGLVTVRRSGRDEPVVRVEELRQSVEQPMGVHIAQWWDRRDWLGSHDLLAARYRRADGITLKQEASHDGDDWDVERQALAQTGGLRWAEEVDPVALALVSGADGTVPMRDQIAVLASAFDTPEPMLAAMATPLIEHLVERGFLVPM
jgi:methylase of polypeptide subunit release factors